MACAACKKMEGAGIMIPCFMTLASLPNGGGQGKYGPCTSPACLACASSTTVGARRALAVADIMTEPLEELLDVLEVLHPNRQPAVLHGVCRAGALDTLRHILAPSQCTA